MTIFPKKEYYHIVTISFSEKDCEVRVQKMFKTNKKIPTTVEWNEFTEEYREKTNWVVLNFFTIIKNRV
jgi:hypothetical protein